MASLGFQPQKEISYNHLLPYKDQLNLESNKFLEEIKYNLSRAVVFKESNPGILYWSNQLSSYIKIYGRKFSKEDHLHFIKLFYELITTPKLDPQYVNGYGHVLIRLLKKRKLISRDDLTLPWRPLYDAVEFMFYSKYESVGLKKHSEYKYKEVLMQVVAVSRVYFSVESTQEMLDEWRPWMCPYDVTFSKAMFYLCLFLPTTLPPEQADKGYRLWFDEILDIWKTFQNPGRMWEEIDGTNELDQEDMIFLKQGHFLRADLASEGVNGFIRDCLKLLSRLARNNIGYIDWNPHIPMVFTRLLRTFSLPIGNGGIVLYPCKDYKAILRSYVLWIISTLGGNSVTQEHITKMFVSLESFYHPSNVGRYTAKLQRLLLKLSSEVTKRLYRERFYTSWQASTPEEKKLTDNDISLFVESVKPAVMLAIFNKFGSYDAANSLQHLAMMKPDLVLPTLLDKLYTALDTLIEPHQLTATLNCVTSVARALVKSASSYPQGKSHVLPLLQLILPGIDPNDFRKSVATFTFISTIIALVPVVDCSEAVGVVEMTEEEKELCLATGQFEDFVLQFMDRCFSLIESSSFENVSELDSSLFRSDQRHTQEGIVGMGLASTFHAILMQSSPQIFKAALNKLFNFCSTNVLEMKVAGKIAADMCRAASKTDAKTTLKKFISYCCSIIEGITSVEGMKHEEETDDQLLWNLQILSEVVRTNGQELLVYKQEIMKAVKSTIHLKNKEAATLSAKLLENLLRPLSYIYPLEWKSLLVDFGKSPKEYLFIRDWGKPGDLFNLNIQWHIPSKEEILFAKEILDNFLQTEMKRIDNFIVGSQTLTREELQQSLRVIQSCLSGGVLLLPSWDKPPLTDIGTKTMVNRGRFHHTVSTSETDVDMGENTRENIAQVMHKLVEHLLCHREDDTKALQIIVKIYESLLLHLIGQRDEFDVRWRGAGAVKRAMEDKLAGKKKHVRALLIERVQLQHEMRLLDNVSSQMTTLHKVLLDDLFTLATSEYTEVRIKAQKVMGICIEVFDYYARSMFPSILANLKNDESVSHEAFKGALYILLNSRMFFLVNHYWEIMKDVWPAIIQANHSEKPSITTLISTLGDKMIKKHDTAAIVRQVPDGAVQCAKAIMSSGNPPARTHRGDPNSVATPTTAELQQAQQMYIEGNQNNLRNYNELVEKLTLLLENENLRWRYLQLCFNFLRTLIRYDQPMPPRTIALFTTHLIHDALAIRKMAISAVGAVLKQQKRPHVKVAVDPYAIAQVPEPTENVIRPGDRPDNLWLHFVSDNLPKTQDAWDRCTFIDKTHWGYYCWPKKLMAYASSDQQPVLGRKREDLSEGEQVIFDKFSQAEFVEQFIEFLSLEDRKGKDKFSVNRFLLFKGLFRNFDDTFLDLFKPHLERLAVDSQESSQRCSVEIIAGLIRGSKHWTFAKTKAMWEFIIPLLRKAIPSITVETLEDWGTCMATAVESRDPRRIHWLLDALLDEPLSGESGSFADASRLYLIQGALCQQEWRVAELLHKLLSIILFRLGHSYKNVRDRSGSVLCSIFMYDLKLPNSLPTKSPIRKDFVDSIIPRLECLMKLTTIEDGANPTAGVDMAKVKEGSAESEAVRLLKTITNWLLTHAVRALNSCSHEFFSLLPCIILFDSQEEDPELQHHCRNTVSYMAQVELPKELLPGALDSVKKIASQNLWYARKSILSYLQLMVFANQFYISQNPAYIKEIQDLLFSLLLDERLEVREMAADTFSGLLHYGIFTLGNDIQDKFRKMAKTKLTKKRKAGASNDNSGGDETARLLKRHAGVLGLASCVKAFPYDVPQWLPEMVIDLGNHLHDPIPIETTVKNTLSSFRRTHHDNWQEHKQMFTEDQLVILTDLLVSPCYYA